MSNILFTRKLGDSSIVRPQATGTAATVTGTVSNLPAELTNAGVGTLIKAFVAAQTNRGLTTLQTDKGMLLLKANIPLTLGNELVLQIQSTGTQTRVLILSVDGRPMAEEGARIVPGANRGHDRADGHAGRGGITQNTGTSTSRTPHANPGTTAGTTRHLDGAQGAAVKGGVVKGPADTLSGQGARANFTTGIRGPITTGLVLPAQVILGTTGNGTATKPGTSASGLKLTSGDLLTVRILGLAPGGNESLKASVPPVGNEGRILHGQVMDSETTAPKTMTGTPNPAARTTLVALDTGRIALAASPPGPSGTKILFEILEAHHPLARGGNANARADAHRDFLRLGTDWQSLKQVLNLTTADATATTADSGAVIARAGPQMASTMLFFMAALKAGDMRAWLGVARTEQLTRSNQGHALGRLGDDFSLMARHAGDALGTGWHSLAVPVDTGQRIEQLRLYYRRQNTSQDGEKGGEATHFMVEADFSRFGLFQLEGLVRSHQFDLVVHSTRALPSDMQGTIKGIFHETLNTGDLAGTIRFDGGTTKPFNPTGGADPLTTAMTGHTTAMVV